MYLFFIDDCRKEKAKTSLLGGFIISEGRYYSLQNKLWQLKARYGLRKIDPIKWSPPKKPEFEPQRKIRKQTVFKKEVLNLINNSKVKIIVAVIHEKQGYTKKLRIECLKKSLEFLSQRYQMEIQSTSKKGRLIIDHPGTGGAEIELCKYYKTIWCEGSQYPTFSITLDNLDETVYYSHGYASDGLQIADFTVGAIGHAIETRKYEYIDLIKNRIRRNRTGTIKGLGVVVYPSNSRIADPFIKRCMIP